MVDIRIAVGGSLAILAIVVVAIIGVGGSVSALLTGGDVGLVLGGLFIAVVGVLLIYWLRANPIPFIVGIILILSGAWAIMTGI